MRHYTFAAALLLLSIAMLTTSCTDKNEQLQEAFQKGLNAGRRISYDKGFREGKVTGFEEGFKEGETQGYKNGYNYGIEEGFKNGKVEGYKTGYTDGRESGFFEGHEKGHAEGQAKAYTRKERHEAAMSTGTIIVLWITVAFGAYWAFYRKTPRLFK